MADSNSIVSKEQHLPDWRELFHNNNSVLKVEIGPGKAQFLLDRSSDEPNVNFIGIEIRNKRSINIQERIVRAGLNNVQVVLGDARQVLPALFAPETVDTFFIHFPDPWPKRRHECRRLISAPLVALLHELLLPSGKVYLTTDTESYAQTIQKLFTPSVGFAQIYAESGHRDYPYHHSIHEMKFKRLGRLIYYFCFAKVNGRRNYVNP